MLRALLLGMLLLPTLAGATAPLAAQERPPLRIVQDPGAGHSPVVSVGPALRSADLEDAARSGVPVRVRMRVELWKDRLFDELVDSTSWSSIVAHEPISEIFIVRSLPGQQPARRFASWAAARQFIERDYRPALQPRGSGRYYYTVSLEVETLSVSDLDELERWLQGELQPAVSGQRSVPGALGQGAKRLIVKLLDLPARRFDDRTPVFQFRS